MRFIFALFSFVVALGLFGVGFAQRTFLSGPESFTASTVSLTGNAVTIIDGATLTALAGRQTLSLAGSAAIVAAYGRSTDVRAWLGDTRHTTINYDAANKKLVSRDLPGVATTVPTPVGSDLWLGEFTGRKRLNIPLTVPKEMSVIIVSDGTASAPSTVAISWPLNNRTPWSVPLMLAGALVLLVSLGLLVWALIHRRRTRGPRRKSIRGTKAPRMPRRPRRRVYRATTPSVLPVVRGRRSTRRMLAAGPIVLVSVLLSTGCASLSPAATSPIAVPSPSGSGAGKGGAAVIEHLPVAVVGQIRTIVASIAAIAVAGDISMDPKTLAPRFTGPALAERAGNYAARSKDSAYAAPVVIPAGPVKVTLPQQAVPQPNSWPRAIFTVVQSTAVPAVAPIALILIQQTPRENYKVHYEIALSAALPVLAPEGIGAPRLSADTKLLSLAPEKLIPAYLDVVSQGAASVAAPLFDLSKDTALAEVGIDKQNAVKAGLPAKLAGSFVTAAGAESVIALGSNAAGALVAANIIQSETVTPTSPGDTANPTGAVKSLSGVAGTTKGTVAEYDYQLLFYIPPIGSTEKITLLGFSGGIVNAKEVP
ncbi:MAG: hypothetical protein H7248_11010 [Microbacteriaceae bacterium]|nr:hypothetical protein [Microbacteriaceae bacterium]